MSSNAEIEKLKKKLLLSEQRFNIAMGFSDVTVFEYDVISKKIHAQPTDFEVFGMPAVVEDGIEEMMASGLVPSRSHENFRELYRKIDAGEPSAKTIIYANAVDGSERVVELLLVNIFDESGKPIYAVGVRKDVTDLIIAQKEKKYSEIIMSDWTFVYEANVTRNRIIRYDEVWAAHMGVSDIHTFSKMIHRICDAAIAPEHVELVKSSMAVENILENYKNGQRIISIEYMKRLDGNGEFAWFRQSVNIIEEEITGDIDIRVYSKNIDDEKQREQRLSDEQRYYEARLQKADLVYEFNMTKNIVVTGCENWDKLFGVKVSNNYTQMMKEFCEKALHPDDREQFKELMFRENVIKAYDAGKREVVFEYRRLDLNGEFIWVSCTLHLFDEPNTGDIKSYCYVQSIDSQKKEQIALIYKSQRDSLTGFYNKATLEEEIVEFLSTSDAKTGKHAFFILDLDFFKAINDNFGHAFGDMFLSQTAGKISSLFRENDILGRIGGDEFVVFMKNVQSEHAVCVKAEELCTALTETYMQNGVAHHVSVSIGIAICNKHGRNYLDLYHNSDTALYYAKEHGRAQYAIYNKDMKFGDTNVKDIDVGILPQGKIFEANISEYVFRILYESVNKEQAINTVLEVIGKYYTTNRVYIFENSEDGMATRNTFEWCSEGTLPQKSNLQKFDFMPLGNYYENFNADGCFYMANIETASPAMRETLAPQSVKSMLQFSIIRDGKFVGFLGFDQCDRVREAKEDELRDSRNMANVIGIFVTEMRAVEAVTAAKLESDAARQQSEASKLMALSIVNGLGSYAYVCDEDTREVLFINDRLQELLPDAKVGDICHKAFWASDVICNNCPLEALKASGKSKFTDEMYNTNLKMWVKATISWIDWLEGKRACLIDSVDITKYIEK